MHPSVLFLSVLLFFFKTRIKEYLFISPGNCKQDPPPTPASLKRVTAYMTDLLLFGLF